MFQQYYLQYATPYGQTTAYSPSTPPLDISRYTLSAESDLNRLQLNLTNIVPNPLTYRFMAYNTLKYGMRYDSNIESTILYYSPYRLKNALNFRVIHNMHGMNGSQHYYKYYEYPNYNHDQRGVKRRAAQSKIPRIFNKRQAT